MRVLYVASEAAPFIKTGGLADVAGSLPAALAKEGAQVRVILPLYSGIPEHWRSKMEFLMYTYVELSWRRQYCGLFSLNMDNVTYYFVDNEYYFMRGSVYGEHDDGERFAFFCRAVIELLPELGPWKPDVLSCNDWQTALVPIYLRMEMDEYYKDIKSVFTIHNIEYQGRFHNSILGDVFGLPQWLYSGGVLAYDDDVNLVKGAIYMSDAVTTVSPSYAAELSLPFFAYGLHSVIHENSHKLSGIINGIDEGRFNPAGDVFLYTHYDAGDYSGKSDDTVRFRREVGLLEDHHAPLVVCVSRLAEHKGFDLVSDALDRIMEKNVQMVIIGTGEKRFERRFSEAAARYPGRLAVRISYSEALASRAYAAAHIFLMPSKSEPCGLAQMIAMRYGTVPVVRSVGGLRDTVRPYPGPDSNGFVFEDYSAEGMLDALESAVHLWHVDKEGWGDLVVRGMTSDFSWDSSAREYIKIYEKLMG